MKTRIPFILALLLAAGTTVRAATNDVLTVAVFDFESKDEAVSGLGPKVSTLINANLSAEPQIITVERAELEKVLGEHELGLSGNVDPASAAKVGQLTGAKVLITGKVFKADDQMFLVAKVIGTETSRVYGEMVQGGSSAKLADLSSELAKKSPRTWRPRATRWWPKSRRARNGLPESRRLWTAKSCPLCR